MAYSKVGTISQVDGLKYTSRLLDDISIGYSEATFELKVYGEDAINNMIENIVFTTPGERPYEPEFGSKIPAIIWDPLDAFTARSLRMAIMDPMARWMPYVKVAMSDTDVKIDYVRQLFDMQMAWISQVDGLPGKFMLKIKRNNDYLYK